MHAAQSNQMARRLVYSVRQLGAPLPWAPVTTAVAEPGWQPVQYSNTSSAREGRLESPAAAMPLSSARSRHTSLGGRAMGAGEGFKRALGQGHPARCD